MSVSEEFIADLLAKEAETTSVPKKKHAGGRPRKWTEDRAMELANELLEYINTHPDSYSIGDFLCSLEAHQRGLYIDLCPMLSERYPQFRLVYSKIKDITEYRIARDALKGDSKINAKFAQFYLERKARGYGVKTEVNATVQANVAHTGININFVTQEAKKE